MSPVYNPVETELNISVPRAQLSGSLVLPNPNGQFPLVLIIAGSGPTDRDGNNTFGISAQSNKLVADFLAANGYASLRYDKRGVGRSPIEGTEADHTFDDVVNDAKVWVEELQKDSRFSSVTIWGHSEGALIGSIVANQVAVDAFVSVSGTSRAADQILLEQLASLPSDLYTEAQAIIASLKNGQTVPNVSQTLYNIFRPSVQPYLISWFQYSPTVEIGKVTSPVQIVHGTTDIQIPSSDASDLAQANPNAQLVIIDGMNHVLKNASSDPAENVATYSDPSLPLNSEMTTMLKAFLDVNL